MKFSMANGSHTDAHRIYDSAVVQVYFQLGVPRHLNPALTATVG